MNSNQTETKKVIDRLFLRQRIKKNLLIASAVLIFFSLIGAVIYVKIHESKSYNLNVDEELIIHFLTSIESVTGSHEIEAVYEKGGNKARWSIHAGPNKQTEEDVPLKTRSDRTGSNYYELPDGSAEVMISRCFYEGIFGSSFNNKSDYRRVYGDLEKGDTRYRNYFRLIARKEDSNYLLDIFCSNTKFVNEIFDETLRRVNEAE